MPTIDSEDAVNICAEIITDYLSIGRAELAVMYHSGNGDEPIKIAPATVLEEEDFRGRAPALVAKAKEDAAVYSSLIGTARHFRQRDDQLPPAVVDWLVDLQLGIIEAPKVRRGKSEMIDSLIYDMVAALTTVGEYSIHRNQEPSTDPTETPKTACDVIAEAFHKVPPDIGGDQLPRSAETVRRR